MPPILFSVVVASFAPDLNGNAVLEAHSLDQERCIKAVLTQEQKGNLAVGDTLDVLLMTESFFASQSALVAQNEGLIKENTNLLEQVRHLDAMLSPTQHADEVVTDQT